MTIAPLLVMAETRRQAATRAFSDALIALRALERTDDSSRGRSCGVSPAQGMLVHEVARTGGSTTRVLARRLGISSSAVTQLVNSLEAEGLLRRAPDRSDGRKTLIELTARGTELYSLFDRARLARAAAMLVPLSDEDVTEIAGLLSKITNDDPNAE
ncbi:MAG: MarR family transcriptional regulator [Anaerosomatales bacterium]|nr:MarR family transcriptional regulator [Anaerosomatales bacterium]MDT8435096.1 MarR family transcriptional regulator [Anaerosomatales bacterium]